MTKQIERDCKHGQLARVCLTCELEAEIDALRAALKRCHGLIETARSLLRVDDGTEQWHEDAEAELSPCDEAGECPALAAAREGAW